MMVNAQSYLAGFIQICAFTTTSSLCAPSIVIKLRYADCICLLVNRYIIEIIINDNIIIIINLTNV